LTYRFTREEAGKTVHRYWTTACPRCPLKAQCTHHLGWVRCTPQSGHAPACLGESA
jgi:hypothetical protein